MLASVLLLAAIDLSHVSLQGDLSTDSARLAREELAEHLELVSGVRPSSSGGFPISLGVVPPGERPPGDFESFARLDADRLWLWGDDRHHGTLFAAYGFLRAIGVDWIHPGARGVAFVRRKDAALEPGWRHYYRPPLERTLVRNYYGPPKITKGNEAAPPALRLGERAAAEWCAENARFFLRHRIESRENIPYGHAFTAWQDRFGKTRPELLAQPSPDSPARGVKGDGQWGKICVSNPATVDQVVADWTKAGRPRYLNVCENDGRGYCRCPACMKLDAPFPGEDFLVHKTDRYVDFWNRVADRALPLRADVKLTAYIYGDYRLPPRKTSVRHPDAMYFGIVPTITDDCRELYSAWQGAGMRHFFLRPNFHAYWGVLPRGYERLIWENFQESRKFGIVGVDYDGYPGRYPTYVDHYVTCRSVTDPDLPFERIVADYCAAYGEAADVVDGYLARVRARGERHVAKLAKELRNGTKNVLDDSLYGDYRFVGTTEADLLGDLEVLKRAKGRRFASPEARQRYADLCLRARHALLTYRFYVEATPAWPDPTRCDRAARDLLEFRTRHLDALRDSYGNIFGSSFASGESWAWWKTFAYAAALGGDEVSEAGPLAGWRSGFEGERLAGWAAREAFAGLSDETAAEGRRSVKLMTGDKPEIGLFRTRVPVDGRARYRFSASFCADPGVESASLRVVGCRDDKLGLPFRELGQKAVPDLGRTWRRVAFDVSFDDPRRREVFVYVNVGKGGAGKFSWVDDIRVERLGNQPAAQSLRPSADAF